VVNKVHYFIPKRFYKVDDYLISTKFKTNDNISEII